VTTPDTKVCACCAENTIGRRLCWNCKRPLKGVAAQSALRTVTLHADEWDTIVRHVSDPAVARLLSMQLGRTKS
jgi:predicted amidophosphoribosyltransferase